eukprot:TRINITY_DN24423_c0_g1_i1.p1 TRINITY_DN24423_c0_g1~~TRINITY_DN24423_c0_g1_i1.p1  ORF type:complete len:598 (+),score=73.90 TRINITY_DN24423_c0_g1_i1:85-1878(+)
MSKVAAGIPLHTDEGGAELQKPALNDIIKVLEKSFSELGQQLREDIRSELRAPLKYEAVKPMREGSDCSFRSPMRDESNFSPGKLSSDSEGNLRVLPATLTTAPHQWVKRHFRTITPHRILEEMGQQEIDITGSRSIAAFRRVSPPPQDPAPASDLAFSSATPVAPAGSHQTSPGSGAVRSVKQKRTTRSEKFLGLVPRTASWTSLQAQNSCCRSFAKRIVCSVYFEFLTSVLLLANMAQLGLRTHLMNERNVSTPPTFCLVLEISFCAWFTLEISLRIFVHRWRYFTMWGYGWNILDLVLVGVQIVEEILTLVVGHPNTHINLENSSMMRSVRVLKAVRVLQVVRMVRSTYELQLIVNSIINSIRTLFWSLVLLLMVTYVIAVYITHTVLEYRLEQPSGAGVRELTKWWGSVPLALLSMFQAATGGVDWSTIMEPLVDYISPWLGAGFVLGLAFTILALMNVITGTFVETVNQQAADTRLRMRVFQASRLFSEIDADSSGYISPDEIMNHTSKPAVKAFFEAVDVDPSEAQCLLQVIDMDGNGRVNFDEFVQGVLRLNGSAKASDLLLVAREMKRYYQHQIQELHLLKQGLKFELS